jgi:hypothetical protein
VHWLQATFEFNLNISLEQWLNHLCIRYKPRTTMASLRFILGVSAWEPALTSSMTTATFPIQPVYDKDARPYLSPKWILAFLPTSR